MAAQSTFNVKHVIVFLIHALCAASNKLISETKLQRHIVPTSAITLTDECHNFITLLLKN